MKSGIIITKVQKYLEALITFDDWIIVSKWTALAGEFQLAILEEADKQVSTQANDATEIRGLAARTSSRLSAGGFPEVEIDNSEKPCKVRYISEAQKEERIKEGLEANMEPLTIHAPLNPLETGKYHPDNLQLPTKKSPQRKEKQKNRQRFTFEEQKEYIQKVIALQTMTTLKLEIGLVDDVLDLPLEHLERIYQDEISKD